MRTIVPMFIAVLAVAYTSNISNACTIFTVSHGDVVLFGNNEDYTNPKTHYWVIPSEEGKFGGVYFGFDDFIPQGGVNEKGLSYDINALPRAPLNLHPELPKPDDWIVRVIMKKCSTVKEAIQMAKRYNWGDSLKWQIHLADAGGDAVVISAGSDGELAFSRKPTGNGYLVSTNFNLANRKNAYSYPCRRYNTAVRMLDTIDSSKKLTVDYCRSILDAVHVEGASSNTLYSNVIDLKNGMIHLYHWHQWDEVVTLDIAEQLAKGSRRGRISDLFSSETIEKASDEHQRYQKKKQVEKKKQWWKFW
jgi:hypothetical protein